MALQSNYLMEKNGRKYSYDISVHANISIYVPSSVIWGQEFLWWVDWLHLFSAWEIFMKIWQLVHLFTDCIYFIKMSFWWYDIMIQLLMSGLPKSNFNKVYKTKPPIKTWFCMHFHIPLLSNTGNSKSILIQINKIPSLSKLPDGTLSPDLGRYDPNKVRRAQRVKYHLLLDQLMPSEEVGELLNSWLQTELSVKTEAPQEQKQNRNSGALFELLFKKVLFGAVRRCRCQDDDCECWHWSLPITQGEGREERRKGKREGRRKEGRNEWRKEGRKEDDSSLFTAIHWLALLSIRMETWATFLSGICGDLKVHLQGPSWILQQKGYSELQRQGSCLHSHKCLSILHCVQ